MQSSKQPGIKKEGESKRLKGKDGEEVVRREQNVKDAIAADCQ